MSGRRAWVRPRRSGHFRGHCKLDRLLHEFQRRKSYGWRTKRGALDTAGPDWTVAVLIAASD